MLVAMRLYHANYKGRVLATLDEIHVATGKDVVAIRGDAEGLRAAGQLADIAARLSALAASLP